MVKNCNLAKGSTQYVDVDAIEYSLKTAKVMVALAKNSIYVW